MYTFQSHSFVFMNVYIPEKIRKHIELGDVALTGDEVFIL